MAIDHEKRRRRVADITIDVIAKEGLGAATIRRIAAEARFSTAAITYYFANKDELLLWAFEVLATEGDQQFEDAISRDPDDVVGALLTMVAWCPANVRRWKAYLAFWDAAARDHHHADIIERSTSLGIKYIERLLSSRLPPDADLAKASRLLNSILQGISLQAIVAPANWQPDRVRLVLQEAVELTIMSARGLGGDGTK